ncbi:MAG: HEAT repeat domain-containing protein [Gemmatimonadetes bacterium]|nr:HEAT repeat domain-containing protein [Gemmatimonadota bacterium]
MRTQILVILAVALGASTADAARWAQRPVGGASMARAAAATGASEAAAVVQTALAEAQAARAVLAATPAVHGAAAEAAGVALAAVPALDAAAAEAARAGAQLADAAAAAPAARAAAAAAVWGGGRRMATVPPPPWRQGDPADSLYRSARQALNDGDYRRAAQLFAEVASRYPRSAYAADALYWQAFALYRSGGSGELRAALAALEVQGTRYPQASTRGDAETLATRINGELARRGDEQAARRVARRADAVTRAPQQGCPTEDDENDMRVAALNALLQMGTEQAMPILRQVLARRDACSATLRRRAVFLVSQKRTPETAAILLKAAREDPDPEVRGQAVFWLSQVQGDEAVDALQDVLRTATDAEVKEKALFALSQHRGAKAANALRAYALSDAASPELRAKAVFWIGQSRSPQNAQFLRDLFTRTRDAELKERILFSLSQMGREMNGRWLMDVAMGSDQPIEIRKKALFWAAQGGAPAADLVALYDRSGDREIKEQLIFAYSQRRDPAFVDKLIDIARHEKDVELRKRAIFWLSQSKDPRAVEVLQEIINR